MCLVILRLVASKLFLLSSSGIVRRGVLGGKKFREHLHSSFALEYSLQRPLRLMYKEDIHTVSVCHLHRSKEELFIL